MTLSIIGRPGSKSAKAIRSVAKLAGYRSSAVAIVNYGLAGKKLDAFFRRFPSAKNKRFINRWIGCDKFRAVKDAEAKGIPVPKTYTTLPVLAKSSNFLTKRFHSQGGIGIARATGRKKKKSDYFQEYIEDRKFELRVHAFSWIPQKDWFLQKRFGAPGEIAWNYHNGGRFQSVKNPNGYAIFKKAKEISEVVLETRKMAFGAVDLLVTHSGEIFFIEVNSAPGFTELSQHIYVDAFKQLKTKTDKELLSLCNR